MGNDTKVAIFIDYDNIEMSVEELLGKGVDVDWPRVLQTAAQMGRVIVRRAYADWAQTHERKQRELLGLGLELIYVNSRRGKNAADIRIVIDALELLFNEKGEFTHVLLVSGDGDFTELVHRLRTQGKVVIGMGVTGTSAEFLVNACDKFIYYDKLPGIAKPKKNNQNQPAAKANGGGKPGPAPANQNRPQTPASIPMPTTPEGKMEYYIHILGEHKIRMTPTEQRPAIIFKLYDLKKNNPDLTFNQLKEQAQAFYAKNNPAFETATVNDIAHQLFHAFCFDFSDDASERILDRKMSFISEIKKAPDLLDKCDRMILQFLSSAIGPDNVDREVAAKMLYGSVRTPRMLEHVQNLIASES
ncbi:MAG: NYN domain-containing protein [Chloroflexi bacterium]|nr:NYN domain-containing protein [Chloroflexota bacterium]